MLKRGSACPRWNIARLKHIYYTLIIYQLMYKMGLTVTMFGLHSHAKWVRIKA